MILGTDIDCALSLLANKSNPTEEYFRKVTVDCANNQAQGRDSLVHLATNPLSTKPSNSSFKLEVIVYKELPEGREQQQANELRPGSEKKKQIRHDLCHCHSASISCCVELQKHISSFIFRKFHPHHAERCACVDKKNICRLNSVRVGYISAQATPL